MKIELFPQPAKVIEKKGFLDLAGLDRVFVASSVSCILRKQVLKFLSEVNSMLHSNIQLTSGNSKSASYLLTICSCDERTEEQGYELEIDAEGIFLIASSEAGAFYGLKTLKQLFKTFKNKIPCCCISDAPDIKVRGAMLDVSRCKVPTMETLYKMIDRFADLKFNQVQLYIEHTFAFSAHESVWHDASPLTAEEIIKLDIYCHENFIELVPNFNSFGHFERWLKHPEFKHMAECPDGYTRGDGSIAAAGTTLKPDQETLDFLDVLYREFLPNFQSNYFNAGCDETWELGQGWSKKQCDKKGKTKVYLDFLLKIHKLAKMHGRKMMFWGDIILHQPELIKELPADVTALEWGYEAKHPFNKDCPAFASSRIPFYVCPGTSSWNTLGGRTQNCLDNLASAAMNGTKYGASGYLITDWGDGGHHQYLPVSYLGFLAGASYSWCFKSNKNIDVVKGMNTLFFDDPTGTTGRLFEEMGRLLEHFSARPHNSTVFNHIFFWDGKKDINNILKDMNQSSVKKCLNAIEKLERESSGMMPECADADLVKSEFVNALTMIKTSLQKASIAISGSSDFSSLKKDYEHIIGTHEALWLSRNRIGGLAESAGRIRNTLKSMIG